METSDIQNRINQSFETYKSLPHNERRPFEQVIKNEAFIHREILKRIKGLKQYEKECKRSKGKK